MQTTASSSALVETLSFDDPTLANALFGPHNAHLDIVAERTGADLSTRGATLAVASEDPALRERILNLFTQFYGLLRSGHALQGSDLEQGLQLLESDPGTDLRRSFRDEAVLTLPKKTVTARNAAQRAYLETLRSHEMVFSVGPAGTGKTYLAVAMAVHMLNARRVRRIILTRPAVEAGEKLGFLPGDLAEKVNPYLRPLHDALLDMLGPQKMASLQETGIIEVAPLAFMRGRTLNDAFIILDEAQNTTREQMKMFLTCRPCGRGSIKSSKGRGTPLFSRPFPPSLPEQGGAKWYKNVPHDTKMRRPVRRKGGKERGQGWEKGRKKRASGTGRHQKGDRHAPCCKKRRPRDVFRA